MGLGSEAGRGCGCGAVSSRCTASFRLSGDGLPIEGEDEFCSLPELSPSATLPEFSSLSKDLRGLVSLDRLLVHLTLLSADVGKSRTVCVRLRRLKYSSKPECGGSGILRVDRLVGAPAGVALAHARMLARVGPP